MTTNNETVTFTLQGPDDSSAVFALAEHIEGLGLMDIYCRNKVSNLAECVRAQRTRPDDEGSHPYHGAATDTFWEIAEEFEELPGVEIDYVHETVTFPASA